MGILGGEIGYSVLKTIAPGREITNDNACNLLPDLKIETFFGSDIYTRLMGKTIVDFGCGEGRQAVAIATRCSTCRIIGVDIQPKRIDAASSWAQTNLVDDRCQFVTSTYERADVILSKDAFEHFADPASVLEQMSCMLKPGGYVLASFGPTWLHPYGGHLFSVFPWSHLIFSEQAQLRWRADFKADGAKRFRDVEGGLNQLTIREFEKLVGKSPLNIDWLKTVPIGGVSLFKSKWLREASSSIVRCKMSLR